MAMTIKQLKESLLRKRRRNIILGIITLIIAAIFWVAITNSIIWLVIFKIIISMISICLFLFAYVHDKNYKKLVKETTSDKP